MKKCSECLIDKDINYFYIKSDRCKDCKTQYQRQYYQKNKETKIKKYREENREILSEKNIEYQKGIREENKEERKKYRRKYRVDNIEKSLRLEKEARERNKEKSSTTQKKYREENREILNEKRRNRINSNPLLRSKERIRILIANSITKMGYTKKSRTHEILGCSFEEFKLYIDNMLSDGMSWDNHGEWHLDHRIPISWAKTEEDIIKLNHYTNFQPLWASENLSKGNRFFNI